MDIPLDIAKILAFSSKEGLIQPNFDVTDELFRSLVWFGDGLGSRGYSNKIKQAVLLKDP